MVRCSRKCDTHTASKYGAIVAVPPTPAAASAVYASIDGAEVTAGLDRLVTAVYRVRVRSLTLDGRQPDRLVPGTAGDGLLLRVPAVADYQAPFALDSGVRSMQLTGGDAGLGAPVVVRFFALPIR